MLPRQISTTFTTISLATYFTTLSCLGRDERRAARRREPAHLPDARRATWLEHPRHEPRRRSGDLHLPGREARPRRPAHGEEGHSRARPHPRHSPRHRPALPVAPPRHPRRRRPPHQGRGDAGRGDARGDRVPVARERQARGGPGERRRQDCGQGRLRLHRARRDAGLDRRGQRGGDRLRRGADASRHHRGDRRAGGDRAPPGHRARGDGRDSGRGRRGQGAVPGGGRGGVRHLGDYRGRVHRVHAVPHRAVRDRHRDPGPRAREALRPGSGVAQHPSFP